VIFRNLTAQLTSMGVLIELQGQDRRSKGRIRDIQDLNFTAVPYERPNPIITLFQRRPAYFILPAAPSQRLDFQSLPSAQAPPEFCSECNCPQCVSGNNNQGKIWECIMNSSDCHRECASRLGCIIFWMDMGIQKEANASESDIRVVCEEYFLSGNSDGQQWGLTMIRESDFPELGRPRGN